MAEFTFDDLYELDKKTRDKLLSMIKEHKDYAMITKILNQQRIEKFEAKLRRRDEDTKIILAQIVKDDANAKRVASLTTEEKIKERFALEEPMPYGWTLQGGGIDLLTEWENEHIRLNKLYGENTYLPKTPVKGLF